MKTSTVNTHAFYLQSSPPHHPTKQERLYYHYNIPLSYDQAMVQNISATIHDNTFKVSMNEATLWQEYCTMPGPAGLLLLCEGCYIWYFVVWKLEVMMIQIIIGDTRRLQFVFPGVLMVALGGFNGTLRLWDRNMGVNLPQTDKSSPRVWRKID